MSSTQFTTFFKFSSALLFLSGEDNRGILWVDWWVSRGYLVGPRL